MEANEKKKGLHYGFVILACCICFYSIVVGVTCNTNGVFFTPVMEDLGVTRTQASFYLTIFFIAACITQPFAGSVMSKYPMRWVLGIAELLYCLGYIWTSQAKSLLVFNIFGVIYGITAGFYMYLATPILLNNWFKKSLGKVNGASQVFINIANIVAAPLIQSTISSYGWRTARLWAGIICLVISVPMTMIFVRNKPEEKGLEPFGAGEVEADSAQDKKVEIFGANLKSALKNPAFYMMCLVAGLLTTSASVMQQISGFGSASALGAMNAAWGLSILSGSAIFVKLLYGVLTDAIGSKTCLMIGTAGGAGGLLLILYGGNSGSMVLFSAGCILFALGYSALSVICPLLAREAFGTRDFARIYSYVTMTLFFCNAVANSLFANIYDKTGSYSGVFVLAAVLYAVIFIMCPLIVKIGRKSWIDDAE